MAQRHDTAAAWVLESWTAALAEVLEGLAGVRPEISFRLEDADAPVAEEGLLPDWLWFEQPLSLAGQPSVWLGAPAPAWRQIVAPVLRHAGLESAPDAEARTTFLEVVGQSLVHLAAALGKRLGQDVRAEGGREILEPPRTGIRAALELTLEGVVLPALRVVLAEELVRILDSSSAGQSLAVTAPPSPAPPPAAPPRTLDLLMEVELPVSVSFGRAELPLKDVLKLTTGSIVELNRTVEEPVELIVNNCVIARGEVVVVDGNYGVRIKQIISPQERLRNLK